VRRAAPASPCETGIKALDLFAPIFPGSLGSARFDAGVGAVVFLAELSARWRRRAGSEGPAVVWVGWERQPVDRSEMEHAFAELDLGGHARLVWSPASDDEEARRGTMARAIREARAMRERGAAHPLLIAFAQPGRRAEIEAALPELASDGSITAIVAERYGDPEADRGPLRRPFDLRISFDPALAAIAHFPALHPLSSASARLSPEGVGEAHCRIAARARELLEQYRRIDPELGGGDLRGRTPDERRSVARARRLQAYLTQPFTVAEPFTGRPGRDFALAQTLSDVEAILAGARDDVEPAEPV
jgi:F-type H+-transporting ATPase subunit beta